MEATDKYVIAAFETTLLLTMALACIKDAISQKKAKTSECDVEVSRGDKSMNSLFTVYAASIAASLTLITNAEGVEGHTAILLIAPFASLTYLFFLSSWFRNQVFFPIANRIRKD